MRKIVFLCLSALVFARENPFIPTGELNTDVMTTNLKQEYEPFSKLNIEPKPGDMLLKEVVLRFVKDDGSERVERIDVKKMINNSANYVLIDAKDTICSPCPAPIVIEQVAISQPNEIAKPINEPEVKPEPETVETTNDTTNVTQEQPAIDKPKEAQNTLQKAEQNVQADIKTAEKTEPKEPEIIDKLKFKNLARFETSDGVIRIYTSAKLVKDFAYNNEKVVLDFSAKFRQFPTFLKQLKAAGFKSINIGAHSGYFRVVIVPNSFKRYILRKINGGYALEI